MVLFLHFFLKMKISLSLTSAKEHVCTAQGLQDSIKDTRAKRQGPGELVFQQYYELQGSDSRGPFIFAIIHITYDVKLCCNE